MRKISLILIAFFMLGISSIHAQKDLVQLLNSNKTLANSLVNSYVEPFLGTFGNNLNNGWYSTAEPLNLGRFTISTGMSVSIIPTSKQTYDIVPSDVIGTPNNKVVTAQTMFGANTSPGDIYIKFNTLAGLKQVAIAVPKGDGINLSPLPLLQGSVGLPLHTELMLRVFPKLDISGYKAGYFGLGFKHDVKQWIPFMSKLPFSLSFIGTYTSASLELTNGPFLKPTYASAIDFTNQGIKYGATSWSAGLIISKKFALVSFYGGFRFSSYKTDLNLSGNYPVVNYNTFGIMQQDKITDPISLSDSGSQFGVNGGVRLKFGFFALGLDGVYNPGGYSSATLGLIFGVFN